VNTFFYTGRTVVSLDENLVMIQEVCRVILMVLFL
jgi:hypothetical protein